MALGNKLNGRIIYAAYWLAGSLLWYKASRGRSPEDGYVLTLGLVFFRGKFLLIRGVFNTYGFQMWFFYRCFRRWLK